jgi:hypothetical protein
MALEERVILVRDVFRLKFGKAREALAAFKEIGTVAERDGFGASSMRVLTDLVGPFYTIVLETTYDSLSAYEEAGRKIMPNEKWRAAYQNFVPFVESGYREILTIVQ